MYAMIENAARPVKKESFTHTQTKPFKWPEKVSGELETYVATLKQDAEKEYLTIGGITFAKKFYHPDKSLAANKGREFLPRPPHVSLYKEEYEALMKRAENIYEDLECRNPKFFQDPENENKTMRKRICYADLIILEKAGDWYNEQANSYISQIKAQAERLKKQEGDRPKTTNALGQEDPVLVQEAEDAPARTPEQQRKKGK